ncbi:GtrA family protein [Celeribacter neptunius]|uniref:Putative flippase GtrA (Transmembrane translocase of bactoprenol-linked glucose) n=1 Tax=Celeribacter neptunius TaxID=588602 RepID=A0A1I3PKS6_9RHOB|nr:GtrA family protein [Celeribacter neptunius]SFJ22092.1 Putative flippase GtrA (transmembrane translocase of bactoprenol-linked glucose) [Celeribacter neptunius]
MSALAQGHRRLTTTQLVLRYGGFAVLATLANLGTQRLVLAIWPEATGLLAALFFGTGVGLVVKYILDKRWIFFDMERGARAHGKKFSLYTAMGLVTTAIFWGMETASWLIWRTDLAREAGAILGLAIGYVVKFHLDRRFVFQNPS